MNTGWLREFVVLADTCSYSEAAERLFMGQSSLSKHIKALEQELGVELFERTSRRVKLSAEGEQLLADARRLVEAELGLEQQARRCRELKRGKLTLAACERAGFAPRVAFTCREAASIKELIRGGLGLAILTQAQAAPADGLVIRPIRPSAATRISLCYKPAAALSPAARAFLEYAAAGAR